MMCGFLVWRVYISTIIPADVGRMAVNDALSSAYAEHGDDLILFGQSQNQTTNTAENYGYFSVVDCVMIPEARQVQVLFRYNNSTLGRLAEDYGIDAPTDRSADYYDLTLVKTTDLTPEDESDNLDPDSLEKTRYSPSQIIRDTTLLYTYRRVVFDDVDIGDAVGLFFDIYYVAKTDYSDPAYGTLCLYDSTAPTFSVTLTDSEKRALK